MIPSKFKENLCSKGPYQENEKTNPQKPRKYLQIIYLTRDLYLDYIKNYYISIIKKIKNWAMYLKRYLSKDVQMANKHMMFNFIIHQGNANQIYNEIPLHTH